MDSRILGEETVGLKHLSSEPVEHVSANGARLSDPKIHVREQCHQRFDILHYRCHHQGHVEKPEALGVVVEFDLSFVSHFAHLDCDSVLVNETLLSHSSQMT